MKNFFFVVLANLIILLIIFFIGEIIVRLIPSLVADPLPNPPWNSRIPDDEFGWHVKPDYSFTGTMTDASGKQYADTVTFNQDGFRAFGNINTPDSVVKIFFVGDSYTQSLEVSDDKLFYNLLSKKLPAEVFAYGAAGYGNIQEYLVVKKYLSLIKPDIIVLQVCDNDFMDNYPGLEKVSNYKVGMKRPYLSSDDKIYYTRCWLPRRQIKEYSYFLYYLMVKYDNMKEKKYGPPVYPGEKIIAETDTAYLPFRESVKITGIIFRRFKELEESGVKVVAFESDNFHPQSDRMKELFNHNKVGFLDGVGEGIEKAKWDGKVVHSSDGYHWSEEGHQLVADTLSKKLLPVVREIQQRKVLK